MPSRSEKQKATVSCVRWLAAALMGWMILVQTWSAWGGPVIGREYDVKIGFIYNFAKFVTWTRSSAGQAPATLVLCYVADDPTITVFNKLDGKTVRGRIIKVAAFQDETSLEHCQIIFFATQDKARIQKILEQARGRSILTIGEIDGFTRWGGIINFFEELDRLRFKVNLTAARREGLKMSSQVLVSAKIVEEEGEK